MSVIKYCKGKQYLSTQKWHIHEVFRVVSGQQGSYQLPIKLGKYNSQP